MEIAMLILAAVCLAQLVALLAMAVSSARTSRRAVERLVVVAEKVFLEGMVGRVHGPQSRLADTEPPVRLAPAPGKDGTGAPIHFEDMPPGQSIGDH